MVFLLYSQRYISIHAPSRERPESLRTSRGNQPFQSTLPHGSDRASTSGQIAANNFNPRSLTGATVKILFGVNFLKFQSTLPHGSDHHARSAKHRHRTFQSTLPHGSDTSRFTISASLTIFQSTLPHGSDPRVCVHH